MSERSIFLIHWDRLEADEFVAPLESHGCSVRVECQDGESAFRSIKADKPVAVLIFLSRLPSHGRLTARSIATDAATRDIPIIFVGGKDWTVEQTRQEFPLAHFVSAERICSVLLPILEGAAPLPPT